MEYSKEHQAVLKRRRPLLEKDDPARLERSLLPEEKKKNFVAHKFFTAVTTLTGFFEVSYYLFFKATDVSIAKKLFTANWYLLFVIFITQDVCSLMQPLLEKQIHLKQESTRKSWGDLLLYAAFYLMAFLPDLACAIITHEEVWSCMVGLMLHGLVLTYLLFYFEWDVHEDDDEEEESSKDKNEDCFKDKDDKEKEGAGEEEEDCCEYEDKDYVKDKDNEEEQVKLEVEDDDEDDEEEVEDDDDEDCPKDKDGDQIKDNDGEEEENYIIDI